MSQTELNAENKSSWAIREESILESWRQDNVFTETLTKDSPAGEFVFFEGPPTANGKPGIHHLEARAFKDIIPRFKTMQGYHVRRKGGWDTHGLPVELATEKQLGLTSKRQIEEYGIEQFNAACKESVHTYLDLWEKFTERIGYWVDSKNAYRTYHNSYVESVWSIVGHIHDKGLLYRDYKVLPWCPRCGTALSSHELAQPEAYVDVKDLSVYAKFKLTPGQKIGDWEVGSDTYILAWTTTPWTLPGNVALAVGADIEYVIFSYEGSPDIYISSTDYFYRLIKQGGNFNHTVVIPQEKILEKIHGAKLAGLVYEPLYPYLRDNAPGSEQSKMVNAFQIYLADFVTTTDGTGVVHTAVMYGADDFELGTRVGLPKMHTVGEDGKFLDFVTPFAGRFVKEKNEKGDDLVAIDIIKDLDSRGLLFKKEKHEHSYPHCWRCKTPLLYYARDSWYVRMSQLRNELVAENEKINWEPAYIKQGRFGDWLQEIKDWAISRERYWGTPLPVWYRADGSVLVIDSIEKLKRHIKHNGNVFYGMRHGQTDSNTRYEWDADMDGNDSLNETGVAQVREQIEKIRELGITKIIASPFNRTTQTAQIVSSALGISFDVDDRIRELNVGEKYNHKPINNYFDQFSTKTDRYSKQAQDEVGVESYYAEKMRVMEFLYDIESKYKNEKILIITHNGCIINMILGSKGKRPPEDFVDSDFENAKSDNAQISHIDFVPLPHNEKFEFDLHRPFIDDIELVDEEGLPMTRTREVMDVWFDSGAMPFAQDGYLVGRTNHVDVQYPADFISEAIDQTRGWFYTLHAIGVLTGRGHAYKNVICLGHLLDANGKKMSKSLGNVVDPWAMADKYGIDTLRLWMYSVNQPGESKNFDERTVSELQRKVFVLLENVYTFYAGYANDSIPSDSTSTHVLDRWVVARLCKLINQSTERLEVYDIFGAARPIRDFIDDLSTWYIRRSRDRFRDGDVDAIATTRYVLVELSKFLAPFCPFYADDLYRRVGGNGKLKSVHLEDWPKLTFSENDNQELLLMERVRDLISIGLNIRSTKGVNVRKPLQSIIVGSAWKFSPEYISLIKEELNVKEYVVDESLEPTNAGLDTNTDRYPELIAEGRARELMRVIQDMRKKMGLKSNDSVTVTVSGDDTTFITVHEADIRKTVGAQSLIVGPNDGVQVEIDDILLNVKVQKN